jgi:RNA polymerase sigma factor (sigma-70 family)
MQLHCPAIQAQIRAIAQAATADKNLHDDLFQEACLHFWQSQLHRPGQTRSWYLQSCQFHLINLFKSGWSLDAPRRKHQRCAIEDESEAVERQAAQEAGLDLVFESVSANDTFQYLLARLGPAQRKILTLLAEGFHVREIATLIGVSHQAVSSHRQTIAGVARDLGLSL